MRLAGLSARLLPALFGAGLGSLVLAAGGAPVRLVGISPGADAVDQAVVIEASEPVAYSVSRPDPLTVLVEMRNVNVEGAATRLPSTSIVKGVDFESAVALDGNPVGRVRLALARPATHKVRSERNTIRLDFSAARAATAPSPARRPAPIAPIATAPAPAAGTLAPAASSPEANGPKLVGVRAAIINGQTVVTLSGNGPLVPGSVSEAQDLPARLVMDFPGVTFTVPGQIPATGAVKRVRVAMNQRVPPVTPVVLDLERKVPFTVQRDGNTVTVTFDDGPQKGAAAAPIASDDAPAATGMVARDADTGELIPIFTDLTKAAGTGSLDAMSALKLATATTPSAQHAPPPPAAKVAPPPPHAAQVAAPSPASRAPDTASLTGIQTGEGQKQYTGNPVSLDFQNADLRSVLRTFAEISGLNMVIDPNVQGSVDIVLTDVPWDQALDTILRANNLGYTVDGTIVRIAALATLQTEQEQRKKLQQAQADAGQLMVRTFTLSYAKAADVSPLLTKSALSSRGQIQTDPRTNTLILTDLPERLDTAANLISILDRAEPQVEVEARVVQTTREFARAIGVTWGFGGRMTPELGNPLPLTFQNNVIGGGRWGTQGPTDSRSQPADSVPTVSNLSVTGEGVSTIGVQLGAVNGAFNLDVALSALERSGKGRVLSTPRLTTQNNVEAEVAQGIQIPIQVVANNTV
ncbi:MAG: secretin N-terminal domain-containing protein, partial [Acidobacteriota bacterium]